MPQLPTHNEAELIERAKIDDAAFSILYETYFPKIYGYVMKRVGKKDEAEDIVSQTFLKMVEKLPNFRSGHGSSFKSWIYTIKENEYVRVVLEPRAKVAIQGGVEVVDVLPAGLLPLTGRFYGYNHGEVRPSRVEGQRVYFHVGKIDESFAYYARVVSKGTYIADPARIQAVKNRGLFNVSEREEVTIE